VNENRLKRLLPKTKEKTRTGWVPPSGHKNIGQANRACPIIGFGRAGAFSAMRPVT